MMNLIHAMTGFEWIGIAICVGFFITLKIRQPDMDAYDALGWMTVVSILMTGISWSFQKPVIVTVNPVEVALTATLILGAGYIAWRKKMMG